MSETSSKAAQPSPEQMNVFNEKMQQAVIQNSDTAKKLALFTAIRGVVDEMRLAGCEEHQMYLITVASVRLLHPEDTAATDLLMSFVCTNCGLKKMETDSAAFPDLDRVSAETRGEASRYMPPDTLRDGPASEL